MSRLRVITFKASEDLLERLDTVARELGLYRSEVIKAAIHRFLSEYDGDDTVSFDDVLASLRLTVPNKNYSRRRLYSYIAELMTVLPKNDLKKVIDRSRDPMTTTLAIKTLVGDSHG